MGQTVEIEVRELGPDLSQDYLQFFDQAFSDFPQWADCYCGFYDTSEADWDATSNAGPEHRAARSALISASKAQGLLAYIDDRPVGWCNAQPRANFVNMRSYRVALTDPREPVGSIMCFVVSPGYRGRGVCTALLRAACDKFRRDGEEIWRDSLGRGELQRTIKRVLEERFQDSSATRGIRHRKKTTLMSR